MTFISLIKKQTALLYNDGGFALSPDGKTLCACAEYWLPDGVDNAMELVQHEERSIVSEDDDSSIGEIEENARTTAASTDSPVPPDARSGGALTPNPSPPRNRLSTTNSSSSTIPLPVQHLTPRTPPNPRQNVTLSPPSPPGRRFQGGLRQDRSASAQNSGGTLHPFPAPDNQNAAGGGLPPPPPSNMGGRPPHQLSIISGSSNYPDVMHQNGRYVPHVVTISLDTSPLTQVDGGPALGRGKTPSVARGYRPRLGQLLEACPLDGAKASAVTCVKFSPSTDFILIGFGVREPVAESGGQFHPVAALYRARGGMTHVSTMLSGDDDVNIARFHPDSGYGFVYGTKQGRVRVLAPRPWNYYG